MTEKLSRSEAVSAVIAQDLTVPEGAHAGRPGKPRPWQGGSVGAI